MRYKIIKFFEFSYINFFIKFNFFGSFLSLKNLKFNHEMKKLKKGNKNRINLY